MKQFILIFTLLAFSIISFGQNNLITNPSCELDPTTNGWTQVSGAWIREAPITPKDGSYFFSAGEVGGTVELYQDIDVSAYATDIDAGRYEFTFSGWIADYGGDDKAQIIVEYRDATSTVLSSYDTGLQGTTSWVEYTDTREAPANTRTIRIRLFSQRISGSYSDGYTDKLSLIAHKTLGIYGPGGVGATDGTGDLRFWYDANQISYSDGALISSVSDLSGYGNTLTASGSERPTYSASGGSNSTSTMAFNGSNELETSYTGNSNESMSFGTIINFDNTSDNDVIIQHGGRNTFAVTSSEYLKDFLGGSDHISTSAYSASTWMIHSKTFSGVSSNGINYYINNDNIDNFSYTIESRTSHTWIGGNGSGGGTKFDGSISEVYKFTKVLSLAERTIINNYLSAKYNITLTSNDIYSQDDSGNGDYDYEVAGIGRVSISDYHKDAQGTGIVRILNPGGLDDDEFLMWGHNNSAQTFTNTSDIPTSIKSRYEREWRVSEVNTSGSAIDVGSIEMRWDLSGQSGFTTSDLRLLIDTDNDGVFADETPISGAVNLGNSIYSFTGITTITDDRRFTLALVSADYADTDGDGVIDRDDIDDDNDGITDATEAGVGCTTTEVYCGGDNGNMYKVDFNAGTVTKMTTSTQTSGGINALASNPDDGVVYYGEGTSMYVYNPTDGSHALLKDFSSEITGANLESGGGAYFNGYLYIAPEDGDGYGTNIYKIPISNNGLTAGTAVSIGDPSGTDKGYGDFVIVNQGSAGIMYGQTSGSNTWEFWKYDLSSNTRTVINSGTGGTWQLALDLYGRLWRGVNTDIQKIDFDGNPYGNIITATEDVWDMTGPFNCVQGDFSLDTDGDGVPNIIDLDSDGDGIPDNVEGQTTTGYTAPSGTDTDGDGLDDAYDPDNGGSFAGTINSDNDGDNDFLDVNADNNGDNDTQEAGLTLSGNDADGDGLDDNVDATSDYSDPNGTINNPSSLPDADGDVNSGGDVDYRDNFNGNNSDHDGDGITDDKDIDDDNDGITDAEESGVSCNITEVYVGGTGGKMYKVDFDAGTTTLMTTSTISGIDAINALASNPDDDVVYYGKGAIMYVYNPADGTHATLKDFSSEIDGENLEGGGAAYYDGYLYIAPEDGSGYGTHIYKIPISNNGLTAGVAQNIATPISNQSYGDFVISAEVSTGVIYGSSGTSGSSEYWKYDLASNTKTLIASPSTNPYQIAVDLYGRKWGAVGTTLRKIDADGNFYGNTITLTENAIDMTGPYNCPQGGLDRDTDGDGVPDRLDLDSDNDGIADVIEAGGSDPDNDGIIGSGAISDTDGDGWSNITDSDNGGTALANDDTDGDGYKNTVDLDSDNDGIVDAIEGGGTDTDNNGIIGNGSFTDTDGDGWSDITDSDDGGTVLSLPNTDGDAVVNYLDLDSDGDGIPDNVEAQSTTGYEEPTGTDTDKDGIDDAYDTNNSGSAIGNIDTDGDGTKDWLDTDSDNEGNNDTQEAGLTLSGNDTDGDGLDDNIDVTGDYSDPNGSINDPTALPDADGDATSNGDVDYRDDTFTDSDGDGVADGFDDDDDNDGILDEEENTCITQQFVNGNFEGNLVNPSDDSYIITDASNIPGWETTASDNKIEIWDDGFNNVPSYEGTYFSEINANETARMYQTLNVLPGDVLKWKVAHRGRSGTDVMDIKVGPVGAPVTQQTASTDNTAWIVYQSNYTVPDGINQVEIGFEAVSTAGGNNSVGNLIDDIQLYLISSNYCDSDGDGVPNYLDMDSDNDGINDVIEAGGSDPDNDGRIGTGAITDTDGDGVSDIVDTDNGGTALPEPDTDGDGKKNFQDIDSDHDGIVDNIEGQTTDSYTAPSGTDANNNGWDDAYDGSAGGTAIVLTDKDGDGTPDYIDTNSDDDGEPDSVEAYDTDKSGTTNTPPSNTDSDGDGLDDAYDVDGTSTTDNGGPTNNNQTANSFPNDDNSTSSERDWREVLSTLPVSLISFEAELIEDYVELYWVTASEINNDYFIVQRSLDNKTFEDIDRVEGNGNSNIIIEYNSYDIDLLEGIMYYRLKQVDYDGTIDYSNVVSIRNINNSEVQIFPNPSNGIINIETKETLSIIIYSISGQQIASFNFEANTNNQIDISNQPKGVYFLTYISNDKSIIKKLIIR